MGAWEGHSKEGLVNGCEVQSREGVVNGWEGHSREGVANVWEGHTVLIKIDGLPNCMHVM